MFFIECDFEEKKDSLLGQVNFLKKWNKDSSLFTSIIHSIHDLQSFTEILEIQTKINELDNLLGNKLLEYNPFEEDIEEEKPIQKEKRVFFVIENTIEIQQITIETIEDVTKQLDLLEEVIMKKQIDPKKKKRFINLLLKIQTEIVELDIQEEWNRKIESYNKMSEEDIKHLFIRNCLYELDFLLEKSPSFLKTLSQQSIQNRIISYWMIEIENKLEELLGTYVLKYTIYLIIKMEKLEKLGRVYEMICKSEKDYYNKCLLEDLLEFLED